MRTNRRYGSILTLLNAIGSSFFHRLAVLNATAPSPTNEALLLR